MNQRSILCPPFHQHIIPRNRSQFSQHVSPPRIQRCPPRPPLRVDSLVLHHPHLPFCHNADWHSKLFLILCSRCSCCTGWKAFSIGQCLRCMLLTLVVLSHPGASPWGTTIHSHDYRRSGICTGSHNRLYILEQTADHRSRHNESSAVGRILYRSKESDGGAFVKLLHAAAGKVGRTEVGRSRKESRSTCWLTVAGFCGLSCWLRS